MPSRRAGLGYHFAMHSRPLLSSLLRRWDVAVRHELASWWYLALFGASALVVALSPSTYSRRNRVAIATEIYESTWRILPWFVSLSALTSLVLIRIVFVTAQSYGLSQYALEMMVRVLVLELIPLSAALFVALRAGMAFSAGDLPPALPGRPVEAASFHVGAVPEVIASVFSVVSLALVSSALVLVLAYLNVYGLSPWGLPDYTRTVGRVFEPAVTAGFAFRTVLFGMAVSMIPISAMLELAQRRRVHASTMQPGAVRLFFVLCLIEAASLAIKYI